MATYTYQNDNRNSIAAILLLSIIATIAVAVTLWSYLTTMENNQKLLTKNQEESARQAYETYKSSFPMAPQTNVSSTNKKSVKVVTPKNTNQLKEKEKIPTLTPSSYHLSYQEALQTYKDSGLFQFVDCHGYPQALETKNGTSIMLDNRDPVPHQISIGNKTVTIKPYHYTIINYRKIDKHIITCDGGGAAIINIQA